MGVELLPSSTSMARAMAPASSMATAPPGTARAELTTKQTDGGWQERAQHKMTPAKHPRARAREWNSGNVQNCRKPILLIGMATLRGPYFFHRDSGHALHVLKTQVYASSHCATAHSIGAAARPRERYVAESAGKPLGRYVAESAGNPCSLHLHRRVHGQSSTAQN